MDQQNWRIDLELFASELESIIFIIPRNSKKFENSFFSMTFLILNWLGLLDKQICSCLANIAENKL